ncbi:5-formyltetrahydrofolate cyclo-ligase [Mangrovicoccus sp. HB182678]|uniref:5-formyltetrahydrofolate cyclo-ligase n=1 Tax=Mangrovicoccus algicola TaxID=2771008 RepID=A0A8J6YZZ5_9RHOB|nr:5-formyltetrahydrofolate cyclo-ligase [Mangrovicoccus algicola]MBE3639904.1 5-formyltetrahydrofolate cyclo-ligase [Mangrovicoccus algicola]
MAAAKAAIRAEAKARRAAAHGSTDPAPAHAALAALLGASAGQIVAGYAPIGTEIDPLPALAPLAATHRLCLPVTHGRGRPLSFRAWVPGQALGPAGFGTSAPLEAPELVPRVLVVPLLAFDRLGGRMGYGAGHYDRTLAMLRARGPVQAWGLAYAAQEFDALPQEPTDQPLDGIVTEQGVLRSAPGI